MSERKSEVTEAEMIEARNDLIAGLKARWSPGIALDLLANVTGIMAAHSGDPLTCELAAANKPCIRCSIDKLVSLHKASIEVAMNEIQSLMDDDDVAR